MDPFVPRLKFWLRLQLKRHVKNTLLDLIIFLKVKEMVQVQPWRLFVRIPMTSKFNFKVYFLEFLPAIPHGNPGRREIIANYCKKFERNFLVKQGLLNTVLVYKILQGISLPFSWVSSNTMVVLLMLFLTQVMMIIKSDN